jgi:methionine biosynthesis protein MetW
MPDQASNRAEIDRWIVAHTPQGGRVLDIGCSEGDLLARLIAERKMRGVGIELSEEKAGKAMQRGLSVHHGDAEEGLGHYGDGSFDAVVISLTIQETRDPRRLLQEAFRVGRNVIVVFPNFGYWVARLQLMFLGRAPRTPSLPDTWYGSPNRHFFTVVDWEEFCRSEGWRPADRGFLKAGRRVSFWANLRAEVAMYVLEKKQGKPDDKGKESRTTTPGKAK